MATEATEGKVDLGDYTLVVTGFPRSGTSLMMRMLMLGGVSVMYEPDRDKTKYNPYGIFEIHNVAEIRDHEVEWTKGKALKIVAPYILQALPINRPLKAIFVQRDINEIIASLVAMRTIWEYQPADAISDARGYLEYNDVPTHFVQFKDLIKYPKSTCVGIAEFLGVELDIDNMCTAVDPNVRKKHEKDKTIKGHGEKEHLPTFDMSRFLEGGKNLIVENDPRFQVTPLDDKEEESKKEEG